MPRHNIFSNRFFKTALDYLSPPKCHLCLELDRTPVCSECEALIQELPAGSCPRCAVGSAGQCQDCRWMSYLDWLRSAVDYEGVAGLAVRLLKFSRNMELAVPMARKMAACPMPLSVDYIVPVPTHWSRRAQRGFNQAEELAHGLGSIDGQTRTELLIRHKATPPQARARGRQRKESLRGAFSSKPCPGVKVLLIDDVVTSGGTLEACAEALKSAGASWVGALTFARQISKGRLQ